MDDIKVSLQNDIVLLSRVLGQILKEQIDEKDFKIIDELGVLSKGTDNVKLDYLMNYINRLTDKQLLLVAKAFGNLINFSQVAEQYNKLRCTREELDLHEPSFQLISLSKSIEDLIAKGIDIKNLHSSIKNMNIEIVLTSNLTQIRRRTLLQKYDNIFNLLEDLDVEKLTESEEERIVELLCYQMTLIWFSEEIRDKPVKPNEEAKWGLALMESNVWDAVSNFLADLDYQIQKYTEQPLPLDASPIKFRTWIGSDKVNNLNVTTETIKENYLLGCWSALDLYIKSLNNLYYSLGIKDCDSNMSDAVGGVEYPYRRFLKKMLEKLRNMMFNIEVELTSKTNFRGPVYETAEEIYNDLHLCYESLVNIGAARVANGELLGIIRKLKCFGLSMYKMDVREKVGVPGKLVSEIIKQVEQADYSSWDVLQKQEYLSQSLQFNKSVDISKIKLEDPELKDCWNTILLLAEHKNWDIKNYVVSKVIEPTDILEVIWLFRIANVSDDIAIVPSFDGCICLQKGVACMKSLFQSNIFLQRIKGEQQIMLANLGAYKEMGFVATNWYQYKLQEELIQLGRFYGVRVNFCYGAGGVSRGGGSAHLAITSQPDGSIKEKVSFSFQGEIIHNIFGSPKIAERSLVIYLVSTLESILLPQVPVKSEWRSVMDKLSEISFNKYNELRNTPNFVDFVLECTPVQELQDLVFLNKKDVDTLDDIQSQLWMYSWTQNRLLFPIWAGVGSAFDNVISSEGKKVLKNMTEEWRYFKSILGLLEMVFAKADMSIFNYYQDELLDVGLKNITDELKEEFESSKDFVLSLLKSDFPLNKQPLLLSSIESSYPFLLPLNFIQIEVLKRIRKLNSYELNDVLRKALYVSFSGISIAMRNTS